MKNAPVFYRNLEEALDVRRLDYSFFTIVSNNWKQSGAIDFCSNDLLGLGKSGALRKEFDAELQSYPEHALGAGASRMLDGNYTYLEMVEEEIAEFHGAETGIIVGSGYEANNAIYHCLARPGDAIVYDELVHASTHDGIKHSNAMISKTFRHNGVRNLRGVLEELILEHPLIRQGKRSILVAVESIYSMDGDFCPLEEMIQVAKDMFPAGNCQFVVDEAHSTGTIGPCGRGLVCELGLEDEVAIRLHTFGKAVGSTGGTFSTRCYLFMYFPVLTMCCSHNSWKQNRQGCTRELWKIPHFYHGTLVRRGCSYTVWLQAPQIRRNASSKASNFYMIFHDYILTLVQAQEHIQNLVTLFFTLLTESPVYERAITKNIFTIPLAIDWESRSIHSHVVAIWIKDRKSFWLFFHLVFANLSTFPVAYPTVPPGSDRVRITFHSSNTEDEVEQLVNAICEWVQEMLDIAESGTKGVMPRAARQVYSGLVSG